MRYLLASLVLVTACVQGDDGGPETGPEDNSIPGTGERYYADVTEISGTCAGGNEGVSGGFVIDAATQTSFHVIPGDGTNPFSCNINGASFSCPDRALYEEDLRPGVDAVVT